jgi:uncharacterized protein YbaP (TraB family)
VRASFAVTLLFAIAPVAAQSPEFSSDAETRDIAVLDEVLVTGEQPGPGLWRVTKDGRTLWILGTYGPLPKKMTWRSREVESIVAESQRLVRWVNIDTDIDVGFFAGLVALPYVFSAGNNPDGAKLHEVVPAEAYAQWTALKAKYIGRDNDVEKLRPAFAALELRSKAVSEAGMSNSSIIWPAVEKLAKKHKVKILEPEIDVEIKVEKPRAMIKKFRQTQLADVECFTQSLSRLEGDIDAMKARANAWATGKVDVLRKIPPPDPSSDCAQMLQQALLQGNLVDEVGARTTFDRVRAQFEQVSQDQKALWLRTVEDALRDHESVLAVVPIAMLFDAQGALAELRVKGLLGALRERGYEVDEP